MIISPKVKPVRFWSQKVLPLVYSDSLSYYEEVDKLVYKMNELIEFVNGNIEEEISGIINLYFADVTYDEENQRIVLKLEENDE